MLAAAGVGSRRRMEELISAGRIMVNEKLAVIGQRIQSADRIMLDGQLIHLNAEDTENRVLMYHKPAGEIVSRDDPQGRPSVFDNLPKLDAARWIAVGRLDFNTSGLLLLTTSGDLANKLMHPGSMIEREYAVRVRGELSDQQVKLLRTGIELDDGLAKLERVDAHGGGASNRWYHVVLFEGRNREVRRLFDAVGQPVGRLMRVRFGALHLPPRLRPGRFVELLPKEIHLLTESSHATNKGGAPSTPMASKSNASKPMGRAPKNGRLEQENRSKPGLALNRPRNRSLGKAQLRNGKNR